MVCFVGAEDAGEVFFAVKRNPCKLFAMVIQETRSKADALACGDIDPGRIVIGTIEIDTLSPGLLVDAEETTHKIGKDGIRMDHGHVRKGL